MYEIILVSIIITTYNRCNLLPRAINSVLNQTYKNVEIIIVDDCSIDKTQEIIKNYQKRYSNIIYIKNDIPSGANVSRNKGIKIAQGEFIAGLDDDDEFLPERIELLMKHYNNQYAFITSNNLMITANKQIPSKIPSIVTLNDMLSNNILMNQGLIEKDRLIKIGLYDESLNACQDYDIWMRLIIEFGFVKVIPEITQIIYMNDNLRRISTKSRKKYLAYFKFYKKYKYLMQRKHKIDHIFRIYDIRSNQNEPNQLPIKILNKKINELKLDSLSIYGTGEFMQSILPFVNNTNIKINYFIESSPLSKTIMNKEIITPSIAIHKGEVNFLIASIAYNNEMVEKLQQLAKEKEIIINIISL